MKKTIGIVICAILFAARTGLAAAKTADRPDPEMLRMMEFLKDWEMLRNMELLKGIQGIGKEPISSAGTGQDSAPSRQKETAK
jgi:hypothetical protein